MFVSKQTNHRRPWFVALKPKRELDAIYQALEEAGFGVPPKSWQRRPFFTSPSEKVDPETGPTLTLVVFQCFPPPFPHVSAKFPSAFVKTDNTCFWLVLSSFCALDVSFSCVVSGNCVSLFAFVFLDFGLQELMDIEVTHQMHKLFVWFSRSLSVSGFSFFLLQCVTPFASSSSKIDGAKDWILSFFVDFPVDFEGSTSTHDMVLQFRAGLKG